MAQETPGRLYRYRSLRGSARDYVERTIVHSEIYFSRPVDFNDPFDCRPSFRFSATKSELRKYYAGVLSRHAPELSRAQRRAEARSFATDPDRDLKRSTNVQKFKELYQDAVTRRIGVLCMSEVVDDILLWSHYADAHQGLCLIFDATHPFFVPAQRVTYSNTRPLLNPIHQSFDELLEGALLTKAMNWKYEREWRLIQYTRGAGIYKFPDEVLVGVVLGASMSREDSFAVQSWVKRRPRPIELRSSFLSDEHFAVRTT